jgi:cellulose synthase operon protein C
MRGGRRFCGPSFGRLLIGPALLALLLGAPPPAVVAQTPTQVPTDGKLLDELARDLARYQEAVRGYRSAANVVIRRAYYEKLKSIRGKYEPQIGANEKEERARRLDAIAMFEAFLRKYPSDARWSPDAMFRLAELYYEKSSDEFLMAQEAYQKALDSPNPPTTEAPRAEYSNTVSLYRRMLVDFPKYRLLDAAYYLLGFCLGEMGQEAEGRQALLALTCSNKYNALDPPEHADPAPLPEPVAEETPAKGKAKKKGKAVVAKAPPKPVVRDDIYKTCEPVRKGSKFLPEAWTRIGEMHFDAAQLPQAISAYTQVLEFADSSYYDKALYKLAWSYYRDNRYTDATREFDRLVKWADDKKSSGDKFGSDLRPEAIQYLAVSFSEPDWNGDTVPDGVTGLQRADGFYRGRESEPHVKEVYQRLGEIYFDTTQYPESIAVFKALLTKWPYFADAPKIQDRIVQAYERDRNMVAAAKERELLGRLYVKGTDWHRENRNNPDALAAAQQLSEDALLSAATNVHAAAQACRSSAVEAKDPAKLAECKPLYQTSAELYEKYLNAYPNAKRAYEFSIFHADALYYSEQYDRAIAAYTTVRDSVLDNRFQREAAYYVIKAYEDIIDRMKAARQLDDPPIPDETNTKPPVTALAMPDVYQKYVGAMDWYITNLKDERVPDLRYAAAVLLLRYRNWPDARARLSQITGAYCGTNPEVGFKAYDALLKTYFIDYGVADEEQQDCALGRLLNIAEQFIESPCSKNPAAGPYVARIQQIRSSVKSKVITKRLELAIENEEKGTERQLTVCREGGGGIAMVTGGGARTGSPGAPAGTPGGPAGGTPGAPAAGGRVSTEMDVGLALDLVDLVNQNPQDTDAPKNLNNVCVIYERIYQYGEATRCYERLAKDYPDTSEGKEAVWNAAKNNERFFNFDAAVSGYLKLAEDPKLAGNEHRKEALGLAATLLDNDQQYARAATLYRRYSDAVADKPRDSAEAFFFSCNAHEKLRDTTKQRQCLTELNRKYSAQPEAGEFVVGSYLKLASLAEQGKDRNATMRAYQKVRDEFVQRGLPAPSPAAAAAAKAEFLLVEEKFATFQARQLKLTDAKKAGKVIEDFIADARKLQDEYKKIWAYKDVTWTLASLLRGGDIFYEFGQKLIKASDNPPKEVVSLGKKACRADPNLCGMAETEYKDGILRYATQVEEVAKNEWKATLARASEFGVTNEYVKKARENLSKYLPDEFPFVKDERPQLEQP